ncbi:hypothetical protein KQI52_01295 [bacterium]|nr:hypothetical protein [bacterium]
MALPVSAGLFEDDEVYYSDDHPNMIQLGLDETVTLAWAHRAFGDYLIRYGVDLNYWGADEEETRTYPAPDTTLFYEGEGHDYYTSLHIDFIKPFEPYKQVRVYVGGGPFFSWGDRETRDKVLVDPDYGLPDYYNKYTAQNKRAGVRALVGGEFAVNQRVGIFFETGFNAYMQWSEYDTYDRQVLYNPDTESYYYGDYSRESDYSRWNVNMSNVMVGITFRY